MAEETTFWRKVRFYSLGLNLVFIPAFFILLFYYVRCRQGFSCDDCFEKKKTITVIDTVPTPKPELKVVKKDIPTPVKLRVKKIVKPVHVQPIHIEKPVSVDTLEKCDSAAVEEEWIGYDNSDELYIYERDTTINDTTYSTGLRKVIRTHSYRILVTDTVRGEIVGGSIKYVNLDPVTVTKVTKFEKEKIHLYIGLAGIYNARHKDRWGLGPSIGLSLPKIGQLGYIYDGRNNAHSFNLQYQVRFFK